MSHHIIELKSLCFEYPDGNKAIEDSSSFTSAELTFLGVTFPEGTNRYQKEGYAFHTTPMDPETKRRRLDLRDLPTHAGGD